MSIICLYRYTGRKTCVNDAIFNQADGTNWEFKNIQD